MIKVSAPGKVHLIGEHAVVYGHPAIIAAVDKRIYIEAERAEKIIFQDDRWNVKDEWSIQDVMETTEKAIKMWNDCKEKGNFSDIVNFVKGNEYRILRKAMIGTILRAIDVDNGIFVHITRCDIPTGSGLGSSSAQAVAMTKSISEVYERKLSLEKINEIAFECEKFIHGNPSGGDNTVSCYGGLVWFQKAQPKNIITPLDISHKLENFVLAYTKEPEMTTGELVQMVREIPEEERNPKMEEISKMTYEMKDVLEKKNYKRMKEIINRTNEILSSFGLAIPETDHIYQEVKYLGGAAKMCGACYGGVMLTRHENPEIVIDKIKEMGFEPIVADLAVDGVRIEK